MYLDARKFTYENPNSPESKAAILRDKAQASLSYRTWINDNIETIIDRVFEIEDIGVVEQVGDFIKLLKEGEFTYSLGLYKSTIALIGICAEDLCRFFAKLSNRNLDSLNQHDRINKLETLGLLSTSNAALLHDIRNIRNDCLHFNQNFSSKSEMDLKTEALLVINTLKAIYADIIGATDYGTINPTKLIDIIGVIANEASQGDHHGVKNIDELKIRLRNVFAAVTGLDMSTNSGHKYEVAASQFEIMEIDLEFDSPEITLKDSRSMMARYVVVDILPDQLKFIRDLNLKEGQKLNAALKSKTDGLGMTAEWNFISIPKLA